MIHSSNYQKPKTRATSDTVQSKNRRYTIYEAMNKPFDYSKWDNIEISDDEDDCHPNIEKVRKLIILRLRSYLSFTTEKMTF